MTVGRLLRKSLLYYWRTHLAVAFGVAIAVAVLTGAFVVGESVRASLREIALERLGRTEWLVTSKHFFRQQLANGAPLILLEGIVSDEKSGRNAARVPVYGVDEKFWQFHQTPDPQAADRDLRMSPALASELDARLGNVIRVRVGKPSPIPAETLHGRKEDVGQTLRFTFAGVLPPSQMGNFSVQQQQGPVRAVFVPLGRLQRELDQRGRANAFLTVGPDSPAPHLRQNFQLEDIGLKFRAGAVESSSMLLDRSVASKVMEAAPDATPIFTYLANTISTRGREIPYSLISAVGDEPGIKLNTWAVRELQPKIGEPITIDFYVWDPSGRLEVKTATLPFAGVVPMSGLGGDRDLAPEYPGISDTDSVSDWDPPFPMDLGRIRSADEDYWERYRTAPKAFISLAEGQKLWGSRFGELTSIRLNNRDIRDRLRASIDPLEEGFTVTNVRDQALDASAGTTDFGEYFVYFSFFLVVSALLLAGALFRFGLETRGREIGLLRAVGVPPGIVRRLVFSEGLAVALIGTGLGLAGALLYGSFILYGLRTWWIGAVGTTDLRLHVSAAALLFGAAGGLLMAILFMAGGLGALGKLAPRDLLAGRTTPQTAAGGWGRWYLALLFLIAGVSMLWQKSPAGFFLAAALLLIGGVLTFGAWIGRARHSSLHNRPQLGIRSAGYRPGRSMLCAALIAFATFVIVSVDAFRKEDHTPTPDYPFVAESQLPIFYDLSQPQAATELAIPPDVITGARIIPLRLRTGDDTSCLNLYQPQNPRVLGVPKRLRSEAPWTLLDTDPEDGALPAIVDANSLTYVLHSKVGDVREFDGGLRVRFVGTFENSVFQSELLISEENFVNAFPDVQGYRMFLVDAAAPRVAALEATLADFGFDAVSTEERVAAYHRVENTYLSTFQFLGALGLLLGTAGLAAVLLRNLLERRRELALLGAVGFTPMDLRLIVLAENALLLAVGLTVGTVCAAIAAAPHWMQRGGQVPLTTVVVLPAIVFFTGVMVTLVAVQLATRAPLMNALRAE
jgi:ABC-type lipoprotein release transport system permease subunit